MVQNPDEVSGGSDLDDSDLEQEQCDSEGPVDSDDPNNGPSGDLGLGAQQSEDDDDDNDDDDNDDDDDDDEELQPSAVAKPQPQPQSSSSGGTLDRFLTKPSVVRAHRKQSADQTKELTVLHKKRAMRTGSASAWGAGAPPPPREKTITNGAQPGMLYAQSDDSDDEAARLTSTSMSQLQNPGVPLETPPDCAQEYDNQRMSVGPSSVPGDEAPKVHESARKVTFVMKNEKVNKWWRVDQSLLLHAPDLQKVAPFNFTVDELTIPNVPARMAMQRKLCKESPGWMASVAMIFKLPTKGKLDLPMADAPGIVMAIPYTLDPVGTELTHMQGQLAGMKGGTVPDTVYGLLALGPEAIKTLYGMAGQGTLPSIYDPTKNSPSTNTKFRVPSKLEDCYGHDEERLKDIKDRRFLIGPILSAPPSKRSSSSKRPAEGPPRGSDDDTGGGGGSNRADGKRPANGPEPAPAERHSTALVAPAARAGDAVAHTEFCGKEVGLQNCQAWSLTCDEDDTYSLFQTKPGKWVLFRGKF
jgi:hypothetical protein